MDQFPLRRLAAPDAEAFRELRLEGLRDHPDAFGASWEDESAKPPAWFKERLEGNVVLAGAAAGGGRLLGVVGLAVPQAPKLRHKGVLWGMYVRPEARGSGLASALLARLLQEAQGVVEDVRLSVVTSNAAAIRLYARHGFEEYGLERRALKLGERYHDELLMVRSVRTD